MRVLLLDEIESILREENLSPIREKNILALMVGEEGKEVVVYVVTEEEKGAIYVMATSYPPVSVKGRELDLLRASWDLVDRGIPCKVGADMDSAVVEIDLDRCHLTKDYLLKSIYYAAESMINIAGRLADDLEGESYTEGQD